MRMRTFCERCNRAMSLEEKETHHHCPECVEVLDSDHALAKHLDLVHTPIECSCGLRITADHSRPELTTSSSTSPTTHALSLPPLHHLLTLTP